MYYVQCDYFLGYVGPEEVLCTDPSDHDSTVVSQPAISSNNPGIDSKAYMIVK